DAGVRATFGYPGEVEGGRAEHADAFDVLCECFGDGEAAAVLLSRSFSGGVVTDGDDGSAEIGCLAGMDGFVVAVSPTILGGVVAQAQKRRDDDTHDGFTSVDKC